MKAGRYTGGFAPCEANTNFFIGGLFMKAKRLISVLLTLVMVLSCAVIMGATPAAAEEDTVNYNEYAKFQEFIKPENNYGLEDTINEGKILQAWNWSYANAIDLMETVAEQGFTAIQISPPNEIKMPTKGIKVCEPAVDGVAPNGWWMFYQPAGFQLNESEDNALGTKAEFIEMCEVAHQYGVKIVVDAVINHMGTDDDHVGIYDNDSTDPMDHVNPRAQEFEKELLDAKAFHSPWKDMTYVENMNQAMRLYDAEGKPLKDANGNYRTGGSATEKDIEESLTQHCTSGLPDLATETQLVQDTIYDYLEELVLAGADGFRFDAAKHIETVHDTYFPSDFWEDTLLKLRANYPDVECYAYGEILNKCGDGRPFSEYTELMDVTDSSSYWGIKDAVQSNGNGGNAFPYYKSEKEGADPTTVNFTKENVIQWNESHDTYIDGGTSSLTVMQRNKIWALSAARQEITGVYFARPDDATGANRAAIERICANITLGDANLTSWTTPEVQAVNQFDNYFGDASEYNKTIDKIAMVERGGLGATLVNLGGTTTDVNRKVYTLSDGLYIDVLTGNEFYVVDSIITGKIGSTGIAVIYYAEDVAPVFPELPTDPYEYEIVGEEFPTLDGYNTVVYSQSNSSNWSSVYYYCWVEGTDNSEYGWPGREMKFARVNDYGEKQWVAYVPAEYNCYIINNGSGGGANQTIDLKVEGNMGMYMKDTSGAEGKWTIGTWDPTFFDITPKPSTPPTDAPTDAPTNTPTDAPTDGPTDAPVEAVLGDADGDNTVNVKDATAIQKNIAGLAVPKFVEAAADANGDEKVDVKDATAIQKWVAGLTPDSPIGK